VDLEERRQLDAASQRVAEVKARARPWRSVFALVLAVVAAVISRSARAAAVSPIFRETSFRALGRTGTEAAADAAAAAFCLFAAMATAGLAGRGRQLLQPRIGTSHAAVIRYAIVLLLARPVDIGDRVWIRSGALGGPLTGTVTEIGLTYVRLDAPDGPLHLPNSQVLAAAVGPVASRPPGIATSRETSNER